MDIYNFYREKNIFITGGSGFIGKAFIEKLLRTFPDLGTIYVLIRSKKGKSAQERLNIITENLLFDKLKSQHPDALKKVKAIEGDISQHKLGISAEERKLITDNVHIIYNVAASVRFDDHLSQAIKSNVRSTRDLLEIASEAKKLEMFLHVSTTYCNTDKKVVEEKVYPAHGNWQDAIKLAEECDPEIVDVFTAKFIQPLRNTYTYAKSLAEHVVVDMCEEKIPAIIVRPSIVIPALREPLKGWIDNFNGPPGILVAAGKGIIRICYGDTNIGPDYIPVDNTADFLIYAVYDRIKKMDIKEVEVYNNSNYGSTVWTGTSFMNMGNHLIWDVPLDQILWFPRCSMTNCFYNYYFQVLLFHMIPALFLDIALKVAGHKPMVFKIQRKIYIANTTLWYFMSRNWDFINTKLRIMQENLSVEERKDFLFDGMRCLSPAEIYEYYRNTTIGTAVILLKEDIIKNNLQNKKKLWRLYVLDSMLKIIALSTSCWYLFFKLNCIQLLYRKLENYIINL